jgi:methylated-DNA-protein-cysteine methyltransferase-like protein
VPEHQDPQNAEPTPLTSTEAQSLASRVYALVRACPAGRVTTYGWIANALGLPRGGARVVGWVLNEAPHDAQLPAQRVINSKGELTGSWAFGQRGRMRALLEVEGVEFGADGRVDLKRFGWDPSRALTPDERDSLLAPGAQMPAPVSDHLLALLQDDPASPFRVQPPQS